MSERRARWELAVGREEQNEQYGDDERLGHRQRDEWG